MFSTALHELNTSTDPHTHTHTPQTELSCYNDNNTDLLIQTIMDLGIPMDGREGTGVTCARMKGHIIIEHKDSLHKHYVCKKLFLI